MFTLNCNGRIIALEKPVVMGIINITPDSFYEGSRFRVLEEVISQAQKMVNEGAAFLDIGGQSTRPGSPRVDLTEELRRVVPVVAELSESFPNVVISIDTYQSAVALEAVAAGAGMVNDISGGSLDPEMIETVARLHVPYVCMHIKGTPETMHLNPSYDHVTKEVLDYFIQKCEACRNAGIHDVILDPGFGFGKNAMHNFQLLNDLSVFRMLGKPLLAGLSRKSTVYKTLGTTAEAALNGTTVMNTLCLLNGADILRVHDVKEAVEAVKLVAAYREAAPSGT